MGQMRTLTINGTKYDVVPVVPIDSLTLLANAWVGGGEFYSQVVEVPDVTHHTKVDLQPTSEQLAEFHYKVLAFVAENNNGVVTVYSVGDKPDGDHTIQITKTEIQGDGPIRGNTVGTTMPRPDWNQNDPSKADYIHNKPYVSGHISAEGNLLTVTDSSDAPLHSLKLYGKTTQNGTPSPDSPAALKSVGDGGSIQTVVYGKNLLNNSQDTWTSHGITFTKNADGSVSYSGTSSDGGHAYYYGMGTMTYENSALFKAGTYIYSLGNSNFRTIIRIVNEDNTFRTIGNGTANATFTLMEDCKIWVTCHLGNAVQGQNYNGKIYPMIRLASITDSTYEPYKGQTLTSATPNGLPGIPVTSGGNYTDENGQAWICDEIDFARGVYVQRIGEVTFKGTETLQETSANYIYTKANFLKPPKPSSLAVSTHMPVAERVNAAQNLLFPKTVFNFNSVGDFKAYLSEQLSNGTPLICLYELETPTETALSAEELTAFAALRTNKPNTTVYNDAGAHMEIGYYTPISALPVAGGAMGGNIRMAGNRITDLGTPTLDNDAANKAYVDSASRVVNGVEEWVNPPMAVGVAYRTTERYKGYPVWVKTIYVGDATANTAKFVAFLNEDEYPTYFAEPIRVCANGMSHTTQTIPNVVAHAADGSLEYVVEVTPTSDMADIHATVWYIRED